MSIQIPAMGQFTAEHPPEPMFAQDTTGPCGTGDGGNPGGISPPVGLCLPINTYLFPLLISGVMIGTFSLLYLNKKQEPMNSIE